MTNIKTKEFDFPRPLYFAILVADTLRRSWWAALFLVGIAVYQSTQPNSMGALWLAFPAAYFIYVFFRCWIHLTAKKNPLFFAARHSEIDEQFIHFSFHQGTVNKIEINKIARVVKNSRYYRLFLTKKQFVYIPLHAFRTPGDIRLFDDILKSRQFKQAQLKNRK